MGKLRCSPLLSAVAAGCFFMTLLMLRNDRQRLYETYYAPIMEDSPRKTLLDDVSNATLGVGGLCAFRNRS